MIGNFDLLIGGNREKGNGVMGVVGKIIEMIVEKLGEMIVKMEVRRKREYEEEKRGEEI